MLISHGWDVKCVEWPNNGLARVGQSHPVPGYAHSDCTYGAARIRALPSMQGTRVDMMRLAIKRMRCKPSYRLPMGACLQAHRTTELFRLDICSMTEWVILRRHRKKFTVCLVFLSSPRDRHVTRKRPSHGTLCTRSSSSVAQKLRSSTGTFPPQQQAHLLQYFQPLHSPLQPPLLPAWHHTSHPQAR